MSSKQIHFLDAARPENVPSGSYAAVYVNGFAWPQSQVLRMHRVFRVSVHRESFWAKFARCIDVEQGAARVIDVVPFLIERLTHGHRDGTVYVNRSNKDQVEAEIDAHKSELHGFEPYYWVATLDGTQDVPGAWAVQYKGGGNAPVDVSVLHGVDNFVRP